MLQYHFEAVQNSALVCPVVRRSTAALRKSDKRSQILPASDVLSGENWKKSHMEKNLKINAIHLWNADMEIEINVLT